MFIGTEHFYVNTALDSDCWNVIGQSLILIIVIEYVKAKTFTCKDNNTHVGDGT